MLHESSEERYRHLKKKKTISWEVSNKKNLLLAIAFTGKVRYPQWYRYFKYLLQTARLTVIECGNYFFTSIILVSIFQSANCEQLFVKFLTDFFLKKVFKCLILRKSNVS